MTLREAKPGRLTNNAGVRAAAAELELSRLKPLLDLFELLAYEGGYIVCTSSLSPEEIVIANAQGRMAVRADGIGFVWQRGDER